MNLLGRAHALLSTCAIGGVITLGLAWAHGAPAGACAFGITVLCGAVGAMMPPDLTEDLLERISPRLARLEEPRE